MPTNKKRLILLTTYYAPIQSVAVNRMTAFVNYLDKSFFEIIVVALNEGAADSTTIEEEVTVIRLANNSYIKRFKAVAGEPRWKHTIKTIWNYLLNLLNWPIYANWQNSAIRTLKELHNEKHIDVLISSYAPVETHIAAMALCNVDSTIKWVADFRDEMSSNPFLSKQTRKAYQLLEQQFNNRATVITSVSGPILENLNQLMPSVPYFLEVMNGYDHDMHFEYHYNKTFTISLAGTFYGASKPDTFFKGLTLFFDKWKEEVIIQFIGVSRNFSIPEQFKNQVQFIDRVPQATALQYMAAADVNLLVLPIVERVGVYSGKLFDYLAVGKPIVAIVDTTDVAAQLIKACNAGFVADFNNVEQIALAIEAAYKVWQSKVPLVVNNNKIKTLHRKYGVEKLNDLIKKIVTE
jgi:glycosyltransferase involved in cell wall biosynthesis